MPPTHDVTQLLARWASGDEKALQELTPIIYKELRLVAASYLRKERPGHSLQPTALVNEAYLRLMGRDVPKWQNRTHFFGVAARLIRQILVDNARRRQTCKRGGLTISLDEAAKFRQERSADLVALDLGLMALEKLDARKSKTIELRYFGGLSTEEIAQALEISAVTVRRDLRIAEAWLHNEMRSG